MISTKEQSRINQIVTKIEQIKSFILNIFPIEDKSIDNLLKMVSDLEKIQGNINNESSFLATLLAKKYLYTIYKTIPFDATDKAQGAPGLDIDFFDEEGNRVVGEIKTTCPYKKNDFGSSQRENILNDIRKLNLVKESKKYFLCNRGKIFQYSN